MNCAEKIVRMTGFGGALHVNDILPDIREATKFADSKGALTALWDNIDELETMTSEGATVESVLRGWKIRAEAINSILATQPKETEQPNVTGV